MSTGAVRTALIVAGGKGTRLRPLTYHVPKPLVPFCGAPFIEGVIRRLAATGITDVRLIVGSETEPFEELRRGAERYGVGITMVPEPEPLDTAGGVRAVADDLDSEVIVLNGDVLTDVDLGQVVRRHHDADADATIVLTRVEETSSYGVAVREGTRIVDFVEKPDPGTLPGHDTVNAGTYVIDPAVLRAHPHGPLSFERDVFPALLERGGRIEGMVWDGVWQDLGTPHRYRQGHRIALDGGLRWPSLDDVPEVAPGVRIAPSAEVSGSAEIRAPALVLPGAKVGDGATIGPHVVVGRRTRVDRGAAVSRGAILHEEVRIARDVRAEGLLAGAGARVERGATLGRDVVLGADAVVRRGERLNDEERRPPVG